MKTILVAILALCSLAQAQRREILIGPSDARTLQRYYDVYRQAASAWAVSRQRFYEPRDPAMEAKYSNAKMLWEHTKSDIGLKYLAGNGTFAPGWEDGAQFDGDFRHIVHADGNRFLIYLPEDMRMDWSIELYLPK